MKIALAILAALVLGWLDYDAEVVERDMYCENVRLGVWPDYKKIFAKECKKALTTETKLANI